MSKNWSTEQKAIREWFQTGSGSLEVVARAGTGKTTTIVGAMELAPESKILYAVFNKKNQVEAAGKISDPRITVKTLHGVGYGFIRSMWPNARPDDKVEIERIKQGEDIPWEVLVQVKKLVGFAKNLFLEPSESNLRDVIAERGIDVGDEFERDGYDEAKLVSLALRGLEASKEQDAQGRISFDDMVWLPVVMGWVKPRFDLVVVDEAQDMNLLQLLMAMRAVRTGGRMCIIGDDRQAIYGFRGAAQSGMEMMAHELAAKILPLTVTYRCPKSVVELAKTLVPDYRAPEDAPEGSVEHKMTAQLLKLARPGDAVLSRVNAPLMKHCLAFLRCGTPARIEGRDIGQMLATIAKKLNARTVPQFLEKLSKWEARRIARLEASGRQDQISGIEDQAETLRAVADGASGVAEILHRLETMYSNTEGQETPKVVLSSVHKAKGLEWDRVFVLGSTFRRDGQEESNIRYVAYTRAHEQLTILSD